MYILCFCVHFLELAMLCFGRNPGIAPQKIGILSFIFSRKNILSIYLSVCLHCLLRFYLCSELLAEFLDHNRSGLHGNPLASFMQAQSNNNSSNQAQMQQQQQQQQQQQPVKMHVKMLTCARAFLFEAMSAVQDSSAQIRNRSVNRIDLLFHVSLPSSQP